jgi:hypothetical protein
VAHCPNTPSNSCVVGLPVKFLWSIQLDLRALAELLSEGKVQRIGKGAKGDQPGTVGWLYGDRS